MAKRKRNSRGHFVSGGAKTVRVKRAPGTTSIIKVSAPRMAVAKKSHHRRRHSSAGGLLSSAGGIVSRHARTTLGVGALALGYAHKEGWLAKIPIVGKAGPVTSFALLGWGAEDIMHMKLPAIVSNAITAAIVLSAFNYSASGGSQILGQDPAYSYPGGAVFFD